MRCLVTMFSLPELWRPHTALATDNTDLNQVFLVVDKKCAKGFFIKEKEDLKSILAQNMFCCWFKSTIISKESMLPSP